MAARRVDTVGAPEQVVHLLPAQVQHDGPAAVAAYFRPQPTGSEVDGLPLLQCSLRGRTLAGVQLPLPAGYSGAVLERRQAEESDTAGSPGGGGAQGERWAATATFPTHMHYWNHDAAPLRGDGLRRCMEWAGLAERLHAPVDPAAALQSLLDFLLKHGRSVRSVWLDVDFARGNLLHAHGSAALQSARMRVRALGCAALALLSTHPLEELRVCSDVDAQWLPRMPLVTKASLRFEFDEEDQPAGPLDWVADRLPAVTELSLRGLYGHGHLWLSAGAAMPAGVRRLSLVGVIEGMEPALGQLEELSWSMCPRENVVAGNFKTTWMEAICQSTRLTKLELDVIYPEDAVAFFDALSTATRLRRLSLRHGMVDNGPFLGMDEVLPLMLGGALWPLRALTYLDLSGNDMAAFPKGLEALGSLKELQLTTNAGIKQLAAGPWQSSLTKLEADWGLADAALDAGGAGHALWGMTALQALTVYQGYPKPITTKLDAFRAAARERVPQLTQLRFW
ncbi:ribonuclease H2 subunit C isoform B [Micractinium conductrix]|uniref:Ribonuclease H2 subunit C isoform B n=1 Tax=Micractinium conductrix TaxID=554055 RepID=A0A2P6V8U8_9CHLO|nr:ribonuclease H2 subunit C isoform B [Micractinium conductrix]|eukprot:PSC70516.1 ribonuclease H2 subunit C isoform B [Micractinium conductrix]